MNNNLLIKGGEMIGRRWGGNKKMRTQREEKSYNKLCFETRAGLEV